MRLVDFDKAEATRRTINSWVSEQTEEGIRELLVPSAVAAALRAEDAARPGGRADDSGHARRLY